ncbi:unnamed protein product, partial [Meganyctiphanes norvegica]
MSLLIILILLVSFLPYQCLKPEVFSASTSSVSNAVWNEATIYDFIENDVFFEVIYPEELRYTYRLRQAKDFGVKFSWVNEILQFLIYNTNFHCITLIFIALEITRTILIVYSSECSFVSKAVQAEKAGALAIIVMDSNSDNDDMYIEMVDDSTKRNPSIPAGFLLGRSGYWIKKVLGELNEEAAIINIPVNLTHVPINKFNQPPWVLW